MKKNIFIILASCAAVLTACTEDFKDWTTPQHNDAEQVQTTELKSITAVNNVDLGKVTEEYVQVFTAEVSSSEAADVTYQLVLTNGIANETLMADKDGRVSVDELQKAVTTLFGKAPVMRYVDTTVYALYTVNGQTVRQTGKTVLQVVPISSFTEYLWVPGDANGWGFEGGRVRSYNFDGKYSGIIYVKGGFKFTNKAGWDGTNYGWGADGHSLSDSGDAGNLWISDEPGLYYVDVDLNTMTYNYTKIETMGIVGDFNSWGNDVVMIWNEAESCYIAENANVTSAGWKFRVNYDWNINFGGSLNALTVSGDNLFVSGTTVKLYPLLNKADDIFCTVE